MSQHITEYSVSRWKERTCSHTKSTISIQPQLLSWVEGERTTILKSSSTVRNIIRTLTAYVNADVALATCAGVVFEFAIWVLFLVHSRSAFPIVPASWTFDPSKLKLHVITSSPPRHHSIIIAKHDTTQLDPS